MKTQTTESAKRRIASAPAHYSNLIQNDAPRFAVIRGADSVRQVEAYLPSNYALMESFVEAPDGWAPGFNPPGSGKLIVIIGGYDNAGWTLDGYVIPRLASGLIFAEEIGKGTEPGAEADEADALAQLTNGEETLTLVVSAGHAEYGYVPDTMQYEYLWAPHGEEPGSEIDVAMERDDWNDETALALFTKLNPGVTPPPDCDLTWENVWRLTGTVEQLTALFASLKADLSAGPGGDDDTYDYWPSGVRLARQIAAALPAAADLSFELGLAVGEALAHKELGSHEVNLG